MRDCRRILTLLTLALPLAAMAEVPVLESSSMQQGSSYPPAGYGTAGAYAGAGAQAPASAQGMLFNQLEQMQQEIAQLRGMLEEQQNEIQRLLSNLRKLHSLRPEMRESDCRSRFRELPFFDQEPEGVNAKRPDPPHEQSSPTRGRKPGIRNR